MTGIGPVLRDALRRVHGAPNVVLLAWAATVLSTLPLTLLLRAEIEQQLGGSLQAHALANGASYDWLQEFSSGASGIASTLGARVIGFAAVLDNISALLDRRARPMALVFVFAGYAMLWMFLSGGIIDRLARDRRTGAHGFFSACGRLAPRLARVGLLMLLVYGWLFGSLYPWLFDALFAAMTAGMTAERTVFAVLVLVYAVFLTALAAANIVFDYTRVRLVVEDRRSAIGALMGAIRFLRRHGRSALALYLADLALLIGVIAVYAVLAPGAGRAGWTMWLAFVVGQAYAIGRVWAKLVFWSSATVLFQSRLAHAGYVARPLPSWPDAPIVEQLRGPRADAAI